MTGVYAVGDTIYAATEGGLKISRNGGTNWKSYDSTNGLGANNVRRVYAVGDTIYAATGGTFDWNTYTVSGGGLKISRDGGESWISYDSTNGLGANWVNGVYAVGGTIYAATGETHDMFTGTSSGGGLKIGT